jgi:hypothetical protein
LTHLANDVVTEVLGIGAISDDEEKAGQAFLVSTELLLLWTVSYDGKALLPPLFGLFESSLILSLYNSDCKGN